MQKPVVHTSTTSRVGLQGMGGIGKSVLAAAVARDREIRRSYPDGVIWISFGQNLEDGQLAQLMRDVALHLGDPGLFENVVQGQGVLRNLLLDKAVLLVLDDVWRAKDAQVFDLLGPRCRALVTTRNVGILHTLHGEMYPIVLFTEQEALSLLAAAVEQTPDQLPPAACDVVRECGCLPLAVALCGGMAKKRDIRWESILQRLRRADLEKIADRQAINEQHRSIYRAMQVSVEVLEPEEQKRFAELSVFVTDQTIPEAAVGTLWAQTGNLDDLDTEDLLINLGERALIRLDRDDPTPDGKSVRRISLHDLLYDYAVRTADDQQALNQTLLDAYRRKCPDGWPSGPNDGYFFQYLCKHLIEIDDNEELVNLLLDLNWLETKTGNGLIFDLLNDFSIARTRTDTNHPRSHFLSLVEEALRRDIHFIAQHAKDYPQVLFQCLWNSAWWYDCPEAAQHYVSSDGFWNQKGEKLSEFLQSWRAQKERTYPGFLWLRSLRPAPMQLETGQLAVLRGHSSWISSVAYSPNGERIVSGSTDKTVRIWDATDGAELAILRGHNDDVNSVAFSPDGRRIVSGSGSSGKKIDNTLRVWDATKGAELAVLHGHDDQVNSVAYSPDGRHIVSGGDDSFVRVWDATSGTMLAVLGGQWGYISSVAYSPDGNRIVSGSYFGDKVVRIWDATSGDELAVLHGHDDHVNSVAYSPDGRRIVSGSGSGIVKKDNTVRVWDAESGAELVVIRGHEDGVLCVAFSPDGLRIVSGSYDNMVRVWDATGGNKWLVLRGHTWGSVWSVAFSPDGSRILSGSGSFDGDDNRDNTVRVWDATSGVELIVMRGHESVVVCVAFSPDGLRIVSGSNDNTVRVWDAIGCTVPDRSSKKRC